MSTSTKTPAPRVDKRPAMLALIERVKQERDVDFVLVHQLSRFARNGERRLNLSIGRSLILDTRNHGQ
jgi:DNA invertase Pin-like site-specific DNA recombinase